jgi:hypothetical protein
VGIAWNIARVVIAAAIIVAVAELSRRYPRYGAVLLSLPVISILAFLFAWMQHRDLPAISQLARDTLVLVPLGLVFFLPFAFAQRLGWSFWTCFISGTVLATATIITWLVLFPGKAEPATGDAEVKTAKPAPTSHN